MLFAIRFTDNPTAFQVRKEHFNSHIEWLKQHKNIVKAAGSLRQKDRDQPVGALWIVEAANEDEAEKVFATDPFWVFGLRSSVEVLSWSLAFEDMLA
ncbi:hypothetical protein JK231_24380 [Pantoea sp. JGM49]|uniref:YciI family protein n=1 Tax=Pantoea sp. JGM49 TaxID=2799791 RepID=UPI001BAA158C|nr:YciI family protein [Pantoea sp. JGM49]MBS0883731.1 hypothetical protein [Pantoea sp. JGM49]